MGTHDWGIISQTIGTVLAPLKGGGGVPFPLAPPEPPPPPPPTPGGGGAAAGAAAQAVKDAVAALGEITTELTDLDASANAKLEAIVAAGEAGKAELQRVQTDVEAKCAELGPRLETPQGQRELQDYVEQRLGQARTVINEAMKTADENARQTRELTDRYAGVGADGTTGGTGGDTGAASSAAGGGAPGGTGGGDTGGGGAATDTPAGGGAAGGGAEPPAETKAEPAVQPASAGTASTGTMPMGAGMPMMPMGAGMPMGGMGGGIPLSLPSLGGGGLGGLPSFGGDPMSALSGLGGGGDQPVGFKDDAVQTPPPADGTALTSTHSDDTTGGDGKGGEGGDGQTSPAGTPIGKTEAVDTPDTGGKGDGAGSGGAAGAGDGAVAVAPPPPPAKTTEVALPNGATTEARSPAGAAAVRAVLGGASVSEGYAQQGVNLPPPGTPVTDPVPPTQLKAGDVGVWKDHMVMALGNKQVLVNGQVQPQESVGSGPDFLGWIDPTKLTTNPSNPPAQT